MSKKQTGPGLPDLGFLNEYVYGYNPNAPEANDPAKQSEFQAGVADWMARGRLKGDDKKDDFTGKREATNLEKLTGAILGVDTDDALQRAGVLQTQRKALGIRENDANKGIDFSKLTDEQRNDPQFLNQYVKNSKIQQKLADEGITTDLDPATASTAEINKKGNQVRAQQADDIYTSSTQYKDSRSDAERNFGIQKTSLLNDAEAAAASLEVTRQQAAAQIRQQELDREYLDRRDQRDYDYRIKKDDQEQLDKIFALILGGVDSMF